MNFQIFNKDILKLLTIFSVSPGSKFSRDELKKKTKMNNVLLDNALIFLLNSQTIQKEKRFFHLNLDNENVKKIVEIIFSDYKKLKSLPFEVYFSILDLVYPLSKYKNFRVYLFGSYSKLIFNDKSDIDIAIISDLPEKTKRVFNKFIQKIEKVYGKEIELHYFSTNFEKQKSDPLVKEILKNGVQLI